MNKVLIIDNYDSFTWNLYQYFKGMGSIVEVKRNDAICALDFKRLSFDYLVISPGPGTPDSAGVSLRILSYFYKKIPILGVCLGHQVIAQFFGAKLKRAYAVMHGKSSLINHDKCGVFCGLKQHINVMRYHSLVIDINTIPKCLKITAWTICSSMSCIEIMGIRHSSLPIEGVQFHPESILTDHGYQILSNFINYC